MNQVKKVRYYDYGSPFYKVYDPVKRGSVYFAVKKYGGKRKAKAAANEYLKGMAKNLTELLRASQDNTGLPRGMSVYATVYSRMRNDNPYENHVVQLKVEAGIEQKNVIQRSVGLIPFSVVYEELAMKYSKRLKLDETDTAELKAMVDVARKSLLKRYRSACRAFGTKPRADFIKNIKS